MPYAVSFTTGRIVRSAHSTEPVAQLHVEQFETEEEAIERACDLLGAAVNWVPFGKMIISDTLAYPAMPLTNIDIPELVKGYALKSGASRPRASRGSTSVTMMYPVKPMARVIAAA